MINMGEIFCHVNKIKISWNSIVSIIWGSQKWNGGIPDFKIIATKIISLFKLIELIKFIFEKKIKDRTIIIEAPAWIIKYLMADLVEFLLILFIKRGMNIIKLISIASHINIHDSEETTTKGVINKIK